MTVPGHGLVLVDTSIWIDLFSSKPRFDVSKEEISRFAVCPPIVQEILKGISDNQINLRVKQGILALPCLPAKLELDSFMHAADIFRVGRKQGRTIRSSVDCLIAAIAIENRLPVWHSDRDFIAIAHFTSLEQYSR